MAPGSRNIKLQTDVLNTQHLQRELGELTLTACLLVGNPSGIGTIVTSGFSYTNTET